MSYRVVDWRSEPDGSTVYVEHDGMGGISVSPKTPFCGPYWRGVTAGSWWTEATLVTKVFLPHSGEVVLGWRLDQAYPGAAWERGGYSFLASASPDLERFVIVPALTVAYVSIVQQTAQKATFPNGVVCSKCNARNPWAVPNQSDGKTFICRDCRR